MLTRPIKDYPEQTLREVVQLFGLRHFRTSEDRKAVKKAIASKLQSPRWGYCDIYDIKALLEAIAVGEVVVLPKQKSR